VQRDSLLLRRGDSPRLFVSTNRLTFAAGGPRFVVDNLDGAASTAPPLTGTVHAL